MCKLHNRRGFFPRFQDFAQRASLVARNPMEPITMDHLDFEQFEDEPRELFGMQERNHRNAVDGIDRIDIEM